MVKPRKNLRGELHTSLGLIKMRVMVTIISETMEMMPIGS